MPPGTVLLNGRRVLNDDSPILSTLHCFHYLLSPSRFARLKRLQDFVMASMIGLSIPIWLGFIRQQLTA
jgi:hypothetical protein